MQFTRTFSCAWSSAMAFVSIVTPPFDAQYAARSFPANRPSTDPIFTIAPPPHFRNSGRTARDTRNGPFRFTIIIRCHSSSLMPSHRRQRSAPALFTNTFSRPNRFTVPLTARATSAARVTSHSIANPAPPCFCNFAASPRAAFPPPSRQRHLRAFARKGQRDGPPNSRPAARNQSHFPRKPCHRFPRPASNQSARKIHMPQAAGQPRR